MPPVPELNPEQRAAVEHGEGPLLVIAGPGTGKTRVITERIVHLLGGGEISPERIAPENILALTYTERAAAEMKRRVRQALPHLETLPFIDTFHAFCYHALRERHFERQLLDKIDVWIFLRRRMDALGLEFYRKLAEPGAFLHDLNDFFSRCQDELVEPEDFDAYVAKLEREVAAQSPEFGREELLKKKELARVFRRSREMIEAAACSSFGSLISETLRLWDREPEVLERVRSRYRYVLVDEFQDTNFAQVELLRRLVAPPWNLTAVGDDDQAIYRFRGASHGQFQMFDHSFPNHRTVDLDRNYRSTRRILRSTGAVITKNDRYQRRRPLRTENPEGPPVYLVTSPDFASEASWIAGEVERLARGGAKFGDVAVLYRSHHYRELLVEEFRRQRIPFVIRGLSILQTTILRDLVAYLKIVDSPHENVSLTRVLLAPRWQFPEETALDIRRQAAKNHTSIWTALQAMQGTLFAAEIAETGWPQLESLLGELRSVAAQAPVTALFDRIVGRLGLSFPSGDRDAAYVKAFRKFLKDWEDKNRNGVLSAPAPVSAISDRRAAVSPLPNGGQRPPLQLHEFMEYFRYFLDAGGTIEAPEPENPENSVQMMTAHAAKGLEFPVVFVLSVARQRFPHREERSVIDFPDELRKGPPPPEGIHLQEERRLFYVALTRARERLYVSSVAPPGRKPSGFVDDLLSNSVVAARDVERIQAPAVPALGTVLVPARDGEAEKPPPRSGQLGLFGPTPPEASAVHPDILGWASRPVDGLQAAESERRLLVGAAPPKLRLSASMIEAYRDCPLKFKFTYSYRIPAAPQATLTFGNLMHRSVRHYFELRRLGLPRFDELRDYYLRSWKNAGFEDDYQEQAYQQAGLAQLREFLERQNTLSFDIEGAEFERAFTLELEDVILQGRIDQIDPIGRLGPSAQDPRSGRQTPGHETLPGGSDVELVDYKTGRPRSQKDADKSLQLSVYALAARRLLGVTPARLTFYNLTNNEPISTVRTENDLERAAGDIHEVASRIRERCFEPTPGFVCRRCDYVPLCPVYEEP
ncbi:MAG TPA: ATP-dependent DNA helicase [Terriglobia bacterium]|nr:ATP-dependent DNA helicase [Terriglobia bacterium]